MLQLTTEVYICDRTGIIMTRCIKVFGSTKKRIASAGGIVLLSIQWLSAKRILFLKPRLQRRLRKGTMHRGLIIRVVASSFRFHGVFIKFNENSAIIVNKKKIPITNRIYGPILREFCIKWPWLGSISRTLF